MTGPVEQLTSETVFQDSPRVPQFFSHAAAGYGCEAQEVRAARTTGSAPGQRWEVSPVGGEEQTVGEVMTTDPLVLKATAQFWKQPGR
ncbi:MAG TPA: hypothetical protein VK988_18350 [Acidimicrobiales bacterium]|nr:hypothetical protein [Acidimicrobiales bacterium]